MVQPHIPPFLAWEIPEEGSQTLWGCIPSKSSELARALDPGGDTSFLCLLSQPPGTLSSKPPAPPQASCGQGLLYPRLHNPKQGCFNVSTAQAQRVVPDQCANAFFHMPSFTWPFSPQTSQKVK